jgi:hypothetical protein
MLAAARTPVAASSTGEQQGDAMKHGIRLVAPFRPFPPEATHHQQLAAFDWIAAIRMLSHSAALACQCPVQVLTDADTDLPVPTLRYVTTHRRLMLWSLEIAVRYLESDDFDRDTVMLDCDQLIYGDLARWFLPTADLGVLVRWPRPSGLPLLNGVQWWAYRGKDRLAAFYRRVLADAETLIEEQIRWGADTIALAARLEPLAPGLHARDGLSVAQIDSRQVLHAFSFEEMHWLAAGRLPWPTWAVLDFRGAKRKPYMPAVYEATIGAKVGAIA